MKCNFSCDFNVSQTMENTSNVQIFNNLKVNSTQVFKFLIDITELKHTLVLSVT